MADDQKREALSTPEEIQKLAEDQRLEKRTEVWMGMERKTSRQREKAEKYYENNLMQLIIEHYREKNVDMVFEEVDYLILSVGTSYEPLLLNISLMKPKRILFLYTEDSESIINKVVNFLHLQVTEYEKSKVDPTDSLSVYQKIKEAYVAWDRPARVYIDFTGGTKTMSAAAALAGSLINVQLVYVGTNEYMPFFRKPKPGSEELFYIDNPIEVFGDFELEKVFALIERFNYAGAAEKLKDLKDNLPDPLNRQQINFVYLLVRVYECWDALEFQQAKEIMEELLKELKRDYRVHKKILMMDFQPILNNQYRILCQLDKIPPLLREKKPQEILKNKSVIVALMHTMYSNGIRREEQEKYDMGALLFYRLLEMIVQKRLMNYGLYVSRPVYDELDFSLAKGYENLSREEQFGKLKSENANLRQRLFRGKPLDYLPNPVALLDGCLLLASLGDAVIVENGKDPLPQLQKIRAMVSLRNNSIFAHGLGPVQREDYFKFRNFVTELFQHFCELEKVNFAVYEQACAFLNPINSQYYQIMGEPG
ncbi:MAG: TIGR02710 family CRISPR-associated CARF protein [Lachnospiraceae bacterium]|nr:TIGR02710 family CRISPR-associated CARF protein [Lachnospiraceae bacterium]